MELLNKLIDIFLHLDRHLGDYTQEYGGWVYLILFVIVFCETGLVVTPFLPGDSLLFAAGAVAAATGNLNPVWLFLMLSAAGILGDTVNYWVGNYIGPKVFQTRSRFLKREHLERTHQFYEKHGGKTIIIARFIPIVRTFAPFVAGVGSMTYSRFIVYNVAGGIAWVAIFIFGGYWFGNVEFVKKNFSLVIIAIVLISVLPGLIEYLRHRRSAARADEASG